VGSSGTFAKTCLFGLCANLHRLRRTALNLSPTVVRRAVGDMKRRVAEVKAARGGLVNE
jgi:hypothetical protein